CIEELNELLAGAVIVPFAVAPDDADQLFERIEPLALAVEREREIEPRLMVERIGGYLLFQFGDRAKRLGLLGQLQGGKRCEDGRFVALRIRDQSQRLLRLLERAGFDVA